MPNLRGAESGRAAARALLDQAGVDLALPSPYLRRMSRWPLRCPSKYRSLEDRLGGTEHVEGQALSGDHQREAAGQFRCPGRDVVQCGIGADR